MIRTADLPGERVCAVIARAVAVYKIPVVIYPALVVSCVSACNRVCKDVFPLLRLNCAGKSLSIALLYPAALQLFYSLVSAHLDIQLPLNNYSINHRCHVLFRLGVLALSCCRLIVLAGAGLSGSGTLAYIVCLQLPSAARSLTVSARTTPISESPCHLSRLEHRSGIFKEPV